MPASTVELVADDSIVKFTSDADVVVSSVVAPKTIPYRALGNTFANTTQDLQSFLTRPVRYVSANIAGGGVAINTIHQTINLDNLFATNTMLADKHAGFYMGRYSARVIVEVNAERFHQGILRLSWLPVGSATVAMAARTAHFLPRSVLPHAVLNVNCDTAVSLDVPWVSPHTHSPISAATPGLGSVILWNQTSIGFGSGSAVIGYTIWVEFYDVDLALPSAQSGAPRSANPMRFQPRRLTPDARENMIVQGKPVSAALSSISMASEYLAKIPLLSSVMGTASWVTQYLANGAYAFGFSKPGLISAPMRVAPETAPNLFPTDAVDNSTYLALSQENKLGCTPWSGSDLDELSLAFVTSRPAIWATQSWNTTQVVDTVLNTLALNPQGYYVDAGTVTQIRYITPLSYATRMAMFWRGSIIFKFTFGKTEFHSGRLSFEYSKNNFTEDQFPRTIVDLREGSEFIITIPYADMKPWSLSDNVSIGSLRIRVLNPLVAPSTAETSIDFNIEVYAGSDFELAGPTQPTNLVPSFAAPAMLLPRFAEAQMAESPEDVAGTCDLSVERVIGPSQSLVDSINPTNFCMGERFTSWRQLIKRFSLFVNTAGQSAVAMSPTILHNRAGPTSGQRNTDFYTLITSCYLGNSGSTRFKYTTSSRVPVTYRAELSLAPVQLNTITFSAATAVPLPAINGTINSQSDRNIIEVATPPYMTGLYRTQNSVGVTIPSQGADNLSLFIGMYFAGTLAATDWTGAQLYRAAGEDYNAGIFIGPPPLALN
jgi:hypothetical protein